VSARGAPLCALAALLLILSGGGPAEGAGGEAVVRGKVTRDGSGIPGGRVLAYRGFDDLLQRRPAAVSEPSGPDGAYRLALSPGTYHLLAGLGPGVEGGAPRPGDLFSFHGSNPFTVAAGSETEASFPLVRVTAPAVRQGSDPGSGAITGVATLRGKPLAGVQVRLYLDATTDFRGMGYAAAPPTDARGAFTFEYLPESSYILVARLRSGGGAGPLAGGDYYGYYPGNPVAVRAGTAMEVEIEMVGKAQDAANADARPRQTGTRISGRITDAAGAPARGAYAFAYEEKVMSHKKPAYLSREADGAGRYVLHLGGGGTFYIGARSAYGDSPQRGEWYGRYDGSADHAVTLAPGEHREGIDIVVERILP
jgi:hypothetical protein